MTRNRSSPCFSTTIDKSTGFLFFFSFKIKKIRQVFNGNAYITALYIRVQTFNSMIANIVLGSILLIAYSHTSFNNSPLPHSLSIEQAEGPPYSILDDWIGEVHTTKAETLSFIIQAGDVLIFNLPESIEGRQVDSYSISDSPALSWIHERSFFWRTLAKDVGKHEILLSGARNGVNTEELVIQVDIR